MKGSRRFSAFFTRLLGAALVLICVFAFLPTAHAEEARINITANPSELPDAGSVTFTFEIANYNADYPMTDVAITYNGAVYDVLHGAQIPPSGSARDITLTLNVSQSQLGKPITFLVTWTRNGEPMSQEAQYTVAQAENPVIEVTRVADKTNAKPGEKVTITYTIKNATKFDMTDITLIDENISDMPIFEGYTLRASQTTSYDFSYTMGDESVTSTPLVTYMVNGKTKTFSSLDPLELTMVLIQLDMRVQAGTPTASGVTFTIDVTNTGTQAISKITITDERANLVNDTPFSLEPGESRSLSYVVVPLMSEPLREVRFQLTGTDPFAAAYELAPADVYEVYPFVDASQINVSVRAETVSPWTQESGSVSARIVITNHSTVELTNITVSEATIGVIKNYDILPAGETSFDQEIQLGSPRNLSFTVKGYDPTGANRTLASYVMPVAYGTETAEQATPTPVQTGGVTFGLFSSINNGIAKVLIILGVLMVFSFIILVALTVMERSRMPRGFGDGEDDFDELPDEVFEPDFGDAPPPPRAREHAYRDAPNQEEISYTKRMFAMKDEDPFLPKEDSIRLPAPQAQPAEQQAPSYAPLHLAEPEPPPTSADELAKRLVETARTRYTEAQSNAAYRPVSDEVRPYAPPPQPQLQPHPQQSAQVAAPRVLELKQRPRTQPAQKQTVTRVPQGKRTMPDDEE